MFDTILEFANASISGALPIIRRIKQNFRDDNIFEEIHCMASPMPIMTASSRSERRILLQIYQQLEEKKQDEKRSPNIFACCTNFGVSRCNALDIRSCSEVNSSEQLAGVIFVPFYMREFMAVRHILPQNFVLLKKMKYLLHMIRYLKGFDHN